MKCETTVQIEAGGVEMKGKLGITRGELVGMLVSGILLYASCALIALIF